MKGLDAPLSQEEMEELNDFLFDQPGDPLDVSGLHGLITAVVIGPELVMPNEWLPMILDENGQTEPYFNSLEEADRIMGLIMRFYTSVVEELQDPETFSPLLNVRNHEGRLYYIIEDWCFGFMRGVSLRINAWETLIESEEGERLLAIPFLFGTYEGLERLDDMEEEFFEASVHALPGCIIGIMDFWNSHIQNRNSLH